MRLLCQLAVLLWVALYLAWPAPESPGGAAAEEIARVMPRPDPPDPELPEPDPPASASPPPAPPAAEVEPAPTPIGPADVAEGARWLDGEGRFPALSCSYEDFDSFRAYARAMLALGARFVVVRDRRVVGTLDLEGGWGGAGLDAAFSPRARDYSDEPALADLAREARERYGPGGEVMMLVPRALDAGLFGGIARALAARGRSPDELQEIRARYQRAPGGGVRLRVETAVRRDGGREPLDLVFDLGEMARAPA
jgi:hypothetical protein